MVTMAICWKAIWMMLTGIAITALFILSLMLIASDSKKANIIGGVILSVYVVSFLVAMYFIISNKFC